jgi:hypothetical protein
MVANSTLRTRLHDIEAKKVEESKWWNDRRKSIINELLQEFGAETVDSMERDGGEKSGHAKSKKKKGKGKSYRDWEYLDTC